MKIKFAGMLRKGNISYYFEVKDTDVYIEKNDNSKRNDGNADDYGHFTLDEGRRCYRALLNKGFKPVIESSDICQPGHSADKNAAFIKEESKGSSSTLCNIVIRDGSIKKTLHYNLAKSDAIAFCKNHNYVYCDCHEFLWDLEIEKASK